MTSPEPYIHWDIVIHGPWKTAEEALAAARVLLYASGSPTGWAARKCHTCVEIGSDMGPSHTGSEGCESGSIASGGTIAHCSCDACF